MALMERAEVKFVTSDGQSFADKNQAVVAEASAQLRRFFIAQGFPDNGTLNEVVRYVVKARRELPDCLALIAAEEANA